MLHYKNIHISKSIDVLDKSISLPASKSIANRALIVSHLANGTSSIHNLSEARDTQTMQRLLSSDEEVLDVLDAGTTMRFLTSYLAATNQQKKLTGSPRMQERPIKILVEALIALGADIEYTKNVGYPPLNINSFQDQGLNTLTIQGDISSQYISSLMMIAPLLKNGLTLNLTGKIGSKPYIEMTLEVMRAFGVEGSFVNNQIKIPPQTYKASNYTVEPDWSAASYWYSIAALSGNATIHINDLKIPSIQGDSQIVEIMEQLGVKTDFTEDGAVLTKVEQQPTFSYDFTDCPDLAQTIAVVCAANGIEAKFIGLESLKIKETDRVAALQNELVKIGTELHESDGEWFLKPADHITWDLIKVNTYDDHRMAMAFAPLFLKGNVVIEEPGVVAKSYPNFWKDLALIGVKMHEEH